MNTRRNKKPSQRGGFLTSQAPYIHTLSRTLQTIDVAVYGHKESIAGRIIIPKKRIPELAIIRELNRSLFEELQHADWQIERALLRAFQIAATDIKAYPSGSNTLNLPSGWTTMLSEFELLGGGGGGTDGHDNSDGSGDAGKGGGAAEVKFQRYIVNGSVTIVIGAGGTHSPTSTSNNGADTTATGGGLQATITALHGNGNGTATTTGSTANLSSWGHIGVAGGAGGAGDSLGAPGSAPANGYPVALAGSVKISGYGTGGGGGSTHRGQGGSGGNSNAGGGATVANTGVGGGGGGGQKTGGTDQIGSNGGSGYGLVLSVQAS